MMDRPVGLPPLNLDARGIAPYGILEQFFMALM
jgi:hypothetical protein